MPKTGARNLLGKGKGYLNGAGSQYRFIAFLLLILVVYTFLLKIFQKLAEIVQLPVFLPVALVTLLVFVGVMGTYYSHKFVGPMARIRETIEHMANGDMHMAPRLRDSDDPMMKDLVASISRLCEYNRNAQALVQDAARDLMADIAVLRDKLHANADQAEIQKQFDEIRKKQDLLDKAIRSHGKALHGNG